LNLAAKKVESAILAFSGVTGIYLGSSKEPDFFYGADSLPRFSIVIESGWTELFPHLRSDKNLWIAHLSTPMVVPSFRLMVVGNGD
jgi:hypothetical protein